MTHDEVMAAADDGGWIVFDKPWRSDNPLVRITTVEWVRAVMVDADKARVVLRNVDHEGRTAAFAEIRHPTAHELLALDVPE